MNLKLHVKPDQHFATYFYITFHLLEKRSGNSSGTQLFKARGSNAWKHATPTFKDLLINYSSTRPSHSQFTASKSVDRRFLTAWNLSIDGILIAKVSVRGDIFVLLHVFISFHERDWLSSSTDLFEYKRRANCDILVWLFTLSIKRKVNITYGMERILQN